MSILNAEAGPLAAARRRILEVLQDDGLAKMFLQQATSEHSSENVELWMAIKQYFTSLNEAEDRWKQADTILSQFIRSGARKQVNMTEETRLKAKEAIVNRNKNEVDVIFISLQETALRQMVTDLLPRFEASETGRRASRFAQTKSSSGVNVPYSTDQIILTESKTSQSDSDQREDTVHHHDEISATIPTSTWSKEDETEQQTLSDQILKIFAKKRFGFMAVRSKVSFSKYPTILSRLNSWLENQTTYEGYLYKRGETYPSWQRRYCIFAFPFFVYYCSKDDIEPKGACVVTRDQSQILSTECSEEPLSFALQTVGRLLYLHTSSMTELHRWVNALQRKT